MTRAEEGLKNPQVQAVIRLRYPCMARRFEQIGFFQRQMPGCSRLNTALRLAVYDIQQLGYVCDDSGIKDAEGRRLWPTT